MKILLKVLLSVFALFILVSAGGIFFLSRGLEAGAALEINEVNLAAISDGAYTGVYKGGRWTNEVSVTVRENKIVDVKVMKVVLIPKPEVTEGVFAKILEKQSPKVEALSGSTVSCKAYMKSVENALNKQ